MAELNCWNCDTSLAELPRPITRHMHCPECFEDLHCCRLCRHFIDNATNPCADERAEPPVNKEGANFCDFFRPATGSYETGRNERRARAESSLNALFVNTDDSADASARSDGDESPEGEENPEDEKDEARRKLDDLFR